MPKVALFLPLLGGGGAERVFANLSYGLVQAGLEVDLVLGQVSGDYLHLLPDSVHVVDLGGHRILKSVRPLAQYLRQAQPDVLFSTLDHANLVALWARWWARSKTRIVLRIASTLSVYLKNTEHAQDRWLRYLIPLFYRFADGITANSQASAEDAAKVARVDPARVRVIYNPSVPPTLQERKNAQPDHVFFTQDLPVILGVGRLNMSKDFATLIGAFAKVRQQMPVKLLILGKGPERDNLLQLARSLDVGQDVSLPGFAANPYAYMAHADAFVLPSRYEGLPNVLIEAIACGCSPISTNSPGGSAEILGHGQYGRLVPVGNINALADAILQTLQNPIAPEKLAQRAQDFTLDATLPQYLDLLGL